MNLAYSWTSQVKRWLNFLQNTFDRWISPVQSPERLAEEQERWRVLQQAIDALPRGQRTVIILHYLEGLSLKEVAYILGIPEGTVKSRLHYARENLRKALLEQERRLVPEVVYDLT